jgi:transposase
MLAKLWHCLKMLSSSISPLIPPKLNPVELLWREIRAKYFKNRIFDTLDAVEETLLTGLAAYYNNKEAVINLSKGFRYFNKLDGA